MAEVIKTGDVGLLTGKVAVLGYGSQGHAHALNLSDSGIDVVVGLRPGSSSRAAAEEAGLKVADSAEAVRDAQIVAFLVPDGSQAALYRDEVAGNVARRRRAALRPRLRDQLRPGRAGRDQRRDHVRAEGPRPHRAPHVRGGLRHAGADRRRPGRDRQRARSRARVRRGDRLGSRGDHRDDLQGRDRDRSLRRAVGALRRAHAADPARLRDARSRPATRRSSRTTSACTR